MKKVILSIRPRFFDLIAIGQKTLELRKTYPKEADSDTPVEVYLYVTKAKGNGNEDRR